MTFKVVALGLICSLITLNQTTYAVLAKRSAHNASESNVEQVWVADLQQKVMAVFHDLFFEKMVEVYVKYANEIDWLRENYVSNRAEGDELIDTIKQDMVQMLSPQFFDMIEQLMDSMPMNISQEEKDAFVVMFSEQFVAQLPVMLEFSLKENMLIESTAYSKRMRIKNRK